jgi:predicted protein tyrosine phosphatase
MKDYTDLVLHKMDRVLFVCTMNRLRSPTAEFVFRKAGFTADSCGIDPLAVCPISQHKLLWSDVIICMEQEHLNVVSDLCYDYRIDTNVRKLISLDIPDNYDFMDKRLIKMLEQFLDGISGRYF